MHEERSRYGTHEYKGYANTRTRAHIRTRTRTHTQRVYIYCAHVARFQLSTIDLPSFVRLLRSTQLNTHKYKT